MFIKTKIIFIFIISLSFSDDISKQTLINNTISEIIKIINNSLSDGIEQDHLNICKNALNRMGYENLYELIENSGKQPSDIGNFWDCVSRNFSYHIINCKSMNNPLENKAIKYLEKDFYDYGLCVPIECKDTVFDYINSTYYLDFYSLSNVSIYSYIPGIKDKNKLKDKEIVSLFLFYIIIFILIIKCLTPIFFGTCLYKYSYLKYNKRNNYVSIDDNDLDDDEELLDDNDIDDENINFFSNNKLNEMKREEEEKHNKTLKRIIFRKHLQSFFSININLNLLISNENFLYNNNYLQTISFCKSLILFMLFYNVSFYALINLPMKNGENEHFYYSFPMICVKYSSFCIDAYIAIEGFIFIYKLFSYIKNHHNNRNFGLTLLLFYTKTIPKIMTCFCCFFIFNIGLKLAEDIFDLSPFVEYIRTSHQKKCQLELSYIFIPFKLQYTINNSCISRFYELCYRFMYINLNIQISIIFSLIIIYLVFKFQDNLFDLLILIILFLNTLFSPISCHHDLGDKFTINILSGETCTIKYTHLFINKFFFGILCGIIYFYHNDIISQIPLYKIYFNGKYIPFSYCFKIMKFLDRISPGIRIIFILVCILFQLLLSGLFIIYERVNNDLTFNTSRFDWFLFDNYEKKIFIIFFMFMIINFLFINKFSNYSFDKWFIFNLIERSSFSMFCTMEMLIYFIYSNFYIRIYLNFHNILFMAISHFFICLFINIIFSILTEQSFKILCKNIFGDLQYKLDIKTVDIGDIVNSSFKSNKKIRFKSYSLSDTLELL